MLLKNNNNDRNYLDAFELTVSEDSLIWAVDYALDFTNIGDLKYKCRQIHREYYSPD